MRFRSFLPFTPAAAFATVLSSALAPAACAQTPSHVYDLNGSLADALGGPAITNSLGGTLGANGVTFNANQGLSLSDVLSSTTYSIETQFSLANLGEYRKIIDFKNRTSDNGLYNRSGKLTFFNALGTGSEAAITADTLTHLVVTRDGATNAFTGYINGVSQFSFIDTDGEGIFSGPNSIAYFFTDDIRTGSEASPGFVDYLRTYDTALNQAEVTNRFNNRNTPFADGAAAPEPGSLALLLPIMGTVGVAVRWRKK